MYASNDEEDWIYLHETPPIKTIVSSISDRLPSIELVNVSNEDCVLSSTDIHDDLERENRLLEVTNIDDLSLSSSQYIPLKQSIGTSTIEDDQSIISEVSPKNEPWQQKYSDTLISCIGLIVLVILGQILTQTNQSNTLELTRELQKTNQRLDEIKVVSIGNFEKKLTEQFEEKLQNVINQQMVWYVQEKSVLMSQIQSLEEVLNKTQRNFTDTIEQLTDENHRLKQQIKTLEPSPTTDSQTCLPGVNCTRLTLDRIMTNLFKRTASLAVDTSGNLSYLFERLSASVSKIVDDRHEYLTKSKRKRTNLTNGKLPRSFHQAKINYASWIKTHAQARMRSLWKPTRKFPWRWTFSRGPSNLRMFPRLPNQEHVCSSKSDFPLSGICSMKNWMSKFFR